jgi:hypothetical protein
MSRSLKSITAEAIKLQKLAEPDRSPVTSRIKEIQELGSAMELAQRAIWSFAHFVPKELVQRVIDNSISTELGTETERRLPSLSPTFGILRQSPSPPTPTCSCTKRRVISLC